MGKYNKNNKQLNTLGKREKLTEAPDDLGFLTDDEIEEQERQEFEKRLAQRKAQRDTVKQGNKWVNKGSTGKTHGEFKAKKQADAQRKAMFVNKKKNSNCGK